MACCRHSRYAGWTRKELIDLLILRQVELRNEAALTIQDLCRLCELKFPGESPDKPPELSSEKQWILNRNCIKLQRNWIKWKYLRRMAAERKAMGLETMLTEKPPTSIYSLLQQLKSKKRKVVEQRLDKRTEDEIEGLMSQLDSPWQPPNWAKAEEFGRSHRHCRAAHKMSNSTRKENKRCSWVDSFSKCCKHDFFTGELTKELSVYGPDVVNYFKFLKWGFWVFALMGFLSLPVVVLNIYGVTNAPQGLTDLSATTFGNLANVDVNGTVYINIPLCSTSFFHVDSCVIYRSTLGLFYCYVDIVVSGIVVLAYVWLVFRQAADIRRAEKNICAPHMYTVMISNLPEDFTVVELSEHLRAVIKGKFSIADISLVNCSEQEIRMSIVRGDLIRRRKRMVYLHRHECTKIRRGEDDRFALEKEIRLLRKPFLVKCAKMDKLIENFDQNLLEFTQKTPSIQTLAFVTFEQRAAVDYLKAVCRKSIWGKPIHPVEATFKGKPLCVANAPDPGVIIWENIHYSKGNRILRKAATTLMAIMMIVASVAIIYGSSVLEERSLDVGGTELCPADFWDMTTAEKTDLVESDPEYLHCYCWELKSYEQATDDLCQSYFVARTKAQILQFFTAVTILGVNILIELVLTFFVKFEKHISRENMENSSFFRIFILKFLNTACVFLTSNNHKLLRDIFGVVNDNSLDFTPAWYDSIGVIIILVQLLATLTERAKTWFHRAWYRRSLSAARNDDSVALTQEELNQMHVGPPFQLVHRYSSILSLVFVCLTFSSGLPVLYFLTALNFLVAYLSDVGAFLDFYEKPYRYGSRISISISLIFPLAFIFHMGMSIWMLSNGEYFGNDPTYSSSSSSTDDSADILSDLTELKQRVFYKRTFPLLGFLVLVSACYVLGLVVFYQLRKPRKEKEDEWSVNFTSAVRRHLFDGITSYSILRNPVYKEKFNVSWEFALQKFDLLSAAATDKKLKRVSKSSREDNDPQDPGKEIEMKTEEGGVGLYRPPQPVERKHAAILSGSTTRICSNQHNDGSVHSEESISV